MLTREEAVDRAVAAARELLEVPDDSTPEVVEQGHYVVTFPRSDPPGTRGPDYHAQVTIDAVTGEVVELLGGS
jgi:hypothetical protein